MKKTICIEIRTDDASQVHRKRMEPRNTIRECEAEIYADEDIDTSDIPILGDEFLLQAIRNPFYRATKTSTTVRIDSDVLAWLKNDGKGYQTRLNAILREAMLKDSQEKSRKKAQT